MKLAKEAEKVSGPFKKESQGLYGSYFFDSTPAYRDTLTRLNTLGVPKDLRGLTVLDLGSNTGGISLELARRGAIVTGLEYNAKRVEVSNKLAAELKLPANFYNVDLNGNWALNQKFDLVFCCSVNRYISNKLRFYDLINEHIGSVLYLESNFHEHNYEYFKYIFNHLTGWKVKGKSKTYMKTFETRRNMIFHGENSPYPVYFSGMHVKKETFKQGRFFCKRVNPPQMAFLKYVYERVKHLPCVPEMIFDDEIVKSPYYPDTNLADKSHQIDFVRFLVGMNNLGFAHGDLTLRNARFGDKLYIIDWEYVRVDCCPFLQSFNVTKNCRQTIADWHGTIFTGNHGTIAEKLNIVQAKDPLDFLI